MVEKNSFALSTVPTGMRYKDSFRTRGAGWATLASAMHYRPTTELEEGGGQKTYLSGDAASVNNDRLTAQGLPSIKALLCKAQDYSS